MAKRPTSSFASDESDDENRNVNDDSKAKGKKKKEEKVLATKQPSNKPSTSDNRESADTPQTPVHPSEHGVGVHRQKKETLAVQKLDVPINTFPKHTFSHASRNLNLEPCGNDDRTEGSISQETRKYCFVCKSAVSPDGEETLIKCHGQMSGETVAVDSDERMTSDIPFRACSTLFHNECIMKYNASGFRYQYAARIECQNKLLCPLHCCSACNLSHHKQSAYHHELIECALCYRSFHFNYCYPSGGKDFYVTMKINGADVKIEMMICPSHFTPGGDKNGTLNQKKEIEQSESKQLVSRHIPFCCDHACRIKVSTTEDPLIECRKCIRSFHKRCFEVETIDEQVVTGDLCESCVCQDTIHKDSFVIVLWERKFWAAITKSWYAFPNNRREREAKFERVGYTVVAWKYLGCNKEEVNIVPISNVALFNSNYFPLTKGKELEIWEDLWKTNNSGNISRCPRPLRLVYKTIQHSQYFDKQVKPKAFEYEIGPCDCRTFPRCTTDDCYCVDLALECPPNCGKEVENNRGKVQVKNRRDKEEREIKGRRAKGQKEDEKEEMTAERMECHNRKLSNGYCHPDLYLKATANKGYGVYTRKRIGEDVYLCEYAGEIISRKEKERRMNIVHQSQDFEANHYLMDIRGGFAIDATNYGNISRYINHSCDPNAVCFTSSIWLRGKGGKSEYEHRNVLKTKKVIEAGEEVTFCYEMEYDETLPPCQCGAENCKSIMGAKKGKKDEEEPAAADQSDSPQISPSKKQRRTPKTANGNGKNGR